MSSREALQVLLEETIGSENVYFQPPSSFVMRYPCIVYALDHIKSDFAENYPYILESRYILTIIDKNPDSELISKIAKLQKCSFERSFIVNNLNHFVFNIYY